MRVPRPLPLSTLLAACSAALAGCDAEVRESAVEILRRPAVPLLTVRLDEGSVRVSEGEGSEIAIEIRRTAQALSRESARSRLDSLTVETVLRDEETLEVRGGSTGAARGAFAERLRLELDIGVPPGTAVDVRTNSGRVTLRGLRGPVRAVTAAGRIEARGLRSPAGEDAQPIRLRSGRGRIEGRRLEGRVDAVTARGRIQIEGRLLEVTAVSGDGSIEVVTGPGGAPQGEWLLQTADGSIRLALPLSTDAAVSVFGSRSDEDDTHPLDWEPLGPLAITRLGTGSGARIHLRPEDGRARVRIGASPE